MLVRRIARPLMSTIFISGGVDALRNPAGRAKAAASVTIPRIPHHEINRLLLTDGTSDFRFGL